MKLKQVGLALFLGLTASSAMAFQYESYESNIKTWGKERAIDHKHEACQIVRTILRDPIAFYITDDGKIHDVSSNDLEDGSLVTRSQYWINQDGTCGVTFRKPHRFNKETGQAYDFRNKDYHGELHQRDIDKVERNNRPIGTFSGLKVEESDIWDDPIILDKES